MRFKTTTLLVVSAAQLLVVLDGTIANIALPSAQSALGMSDVDRHWAITAYALAFGGLLLIGGRISGALGHRRAFAIGLIGFAAASAFGGAAGSPGMLIAARGVQGVFAALLAPAGLSLLTNTFTEAQERGRAFGVFAAVGAAGSAIGLIAGGLLTEYTDWRWCLYINVPVALLAVLGTAFVPKIQGEPARLDIAGALLSAVGFAAVVYGLSQADVGVLAAGVVLLAAFIAVETRVRQPLLPMRVLLDRVRGGAFLAITLMFFAMFGFYLFMSYYTQTVLGYSPVLAGLTLIINAVAALLGAVLAGRLRRPVVIGLFLAAVGMLVPGMVFALVLTGLGLGLVMPPTASLATAGLRGHDIGAASAAYNAAQQLGAALGTALLNTAAPAVGGGVLLVAAVLLCIDGTRVARGGLAINREHS
ncbi:MFS transporter [Allokutzneria sp. A3M-2-11 16]|uniref:MFS transporter n=1 Tax=Allokutzneria sp. A3M-2-11 16 TaxID=2962043 RepID=UPI0020B6C6FD|nr:MFS transporter [Allokutzneria sp. A3M-2-11 16]MCP3798118.1 MFS transporter [Allokutzneria sp. A3M-2-11 16]